MNGAFLWTGQWTTKLLNFLFWIRLRGASRGCRNLLRTSAREGGAGREPRIRTVRQLTAVAGDGPLGSVGSPGQLETSLNSGYLVGPCNSYLEGPTLVFGRLLAPLVWPCCSRNRAWNPPPSSSLAEEERLRLLLLCAAARDFPTLAAHVAAPTPRGAIADARSSGAR
jgi:hypothetical protein